MSRVAGIDLPSKKVLKVALTYIFGVGPHLAEKLLIQTKIDGQKRVKDLTEDEVLRIREVVRDYIVEGDLRRQLGQNKRRLIDIGSYRGYRHKRNLPARGQRTHTNARTKRGKRVAVAGKKKVTK